MQSWMKRPECLPLLAATMLLAAMPLRAANLPPMIDAHAHYTAEDAQALPPAAITARLDAAGVHRIAVTAAPPDLAQLLYRHAPARIIPLLGVYRAGTNKMNWMRDAGLPEKTAAMLKLGTWAGMGELHLFAEDAGNPVFAELVKLAGANGLLLMIHGDAEVVDKAFELAPGLRVLWAHLGTDPRPEALANMLDRHPDNLWIDTSVRDERMAPAGKLLPQWRDLFVRYPNRFLAAVDTFSLNRWQHYEEVVGNIRAWVGQLPKDVQHKLLYDNAAQLFNRFPDK